nr:uncharacterized protein LOC109744769 [Aegilops tauschii subsp. strangulata]
MARAKLLLNFPPAADKMDEWRATIQSLIGCAKANKSQHGEPLRRPQATLPALAGDDVERTTPAVLSPLQQPIQGQPWRSQQTQDVDELDEVSMASFDPRAQQDQRQVLRDMKKEDSRVTIEQRHETRRMRAKMNVRLSKTVNELYTLADKCAHAEEGRRLPGEEIGVEVDSEDDDDATAPRKKNIKCNKKHKGKAVMAVESSSDPCAGKKAKTETLGKEAAACAIAGRLRWLRNWRVDQLVERQKAKYEKCDKEKAQDDAGRKGRGGHGGHRDKDNQQKEKPARCREKKEDEDDSEEEEDDESSEQEFQKATKLPKTVNELYMLADKCARAEEGRRLPGEEIGVEVDTEDGDNATAPRKKNKKRNKKCKEKSVMAVESSNDPNTGKKANTETAGKQAIACANFWTAAVAKKMSKFDGPYCMIHRTKGHDLHDCRRVEQLVERQKAE